MKKTILFLLMAMLSPSLAISAEDPIVCPPDKPLNEFNRECFSCDTLRGVYNQECSNICPNRRLDKYGHACILKECPPDNPLRGPGDTACSRNDAYGLTDWDCAQIPGTQFFEDNDGATGICTFACPEDKPIKVKQTEGFKCFSCDDPAALDLGFRQSYERSNCLQCTNRELNGDICFLKGECPKDFPIRDSNGGCRAINDPLPIKFMEPKISPKDKKEAIKAYFAVENKEFQKERCALYPERIYKDIDNHYNSSCILKTCPKDKPLRIKGGCYACDTTEKFKTDEQACKICPNRVMYGKLCSLPCPADKPLADGNGECHACNEEGKIYSEACSVCAEREQVGEYCNLKCQGEKPLQGKDGRCYSCQTKHIEIVSKEKCDVCPNSVYLYIKERNEHLCISCPADKPLISEETGECFACTDDRAIKLIESQKDNKLCGDMRKTVNGYSALKECPEGLLVDNHGECWNCDNNHSLIDVSGTEENCSVCSNRIVKNGYCIIDNKEKPILKIEKRYKSISQYSCEEKGDYGIGLREIDVTGTEDTCLLCPNRRIRKTKEAGEIRSYCIGKE